LPICVGLAFLLMDPAGEPLPAPRGTRSGTPEDADPALNRTVLHPIGWCSLEILLAWVPQQATDEDNFG